jgi:queuine/archaeosine tRNA-ribosyltransferase
MSCLYLEAKWREDVVCTYLGHLILHDDKFREMPAAMREERSCYTCKGANEDSEKKHLRRLHRPTTYVQFVQVKVHSSLLYALYTAPSGIQPWYLGW